MTHEGEFRTNTVRFALTDDGVALPVIDVTSPAFALTAGEPEVAERCRLFVEESRARQNMSAEARAQMMQALRGSRLAQALTQASGGYLSGLATYLMKLGPDHLWPDAGEVDKRIAASFPAWTARLRLQDVARLLAEGLTPQLEREPTQPLILVNIAGGPASDAINALLVVRAASRMRSHTAARSSGCSIPTMWARRAARQGHKVLRETACRTTSPHGRNRAPR